MKLRQIFRFLSYYLPDSFRSRGLKTYAGLKKLLPGRAYYCKALTGESDYNICINSDLTVSCNCMDYDASGHIGDLKESSFEEIFEGDTAQNFRDQLATGKLPISQCSGCFDLQATSRKKAKEKAKNWKIPHKGIMVENTVVCNFACIACDRSIVSTRQSENGRSGGRLMSSKDIELVAKVVQKHSIERVYYFNQGEPFLSRDILKEMQILRKHNPDTKILVSTNGTFIEGEDKLQAAMLFDVIFLSIDGSSQKTVEIYQVGGTFERSLENMRRLVAYRDERKLSKPSIEWKYVVFEWNDSEEEINRAISLAKKANIDKLSFVKGGMPDQKGESRRFITSPFFRNLGTPGWQGRELIFRTPSTDAPAKSA